MDSYSGGELKEACDDSPMTDGASEGEQIGGQVTQWATNDGNMYYAVGRTTQSFPPGAYDINIVNDQIVFQRFEIDTIGLLRLPDTVSDRVIAEIEKFWNNTERFVKYSLPQRRGILIAGPSGCGKTSTSRMVCTDVIKRGGIVIPYNRPKLLMRGMTLFRQIQPDTPVVVLMEDLDEIASNGDSSMFLNMLDGIYAALNRIVFVATTNHPDRLERRVTNRPSRFDYVIQMKQPVREARLQYLNTISMDLKDKTFCPETIADDTAGLSFAHLKEIFVSVAILDVPYQDALDKVRKMADCDLMTGDEMEYGDDRGHMGLIRPSTPVSMSRRRSR